MQMHSQTRSSMFSFACKMDIMRCSNRNSSIFRLVQSTRTPFTDYLPNWREECLWRCTVAFVPIPSPSPHENEEMIRFELIHLDEVVCSRKCTHFAHRHVEFSNLFPFRHFHFKSIQMQAHQFCRHKKGTNVGKKMSCLLQKCLIFMLNHHSNL